VNTSATPTPPLARRLAPGVRRPRCGGSRELTFDHPESHPHFIEFVTIENIHRAEHMAKLNGLAQLNSSTIAVLE
jgi:hypothetical protein